MKAAKVGTFFLLGAAWVALSASSVGAGTPFVPIVERDSGWESMGVQEGVAVFRKEIPGDPVIAFRGEGIVNAPITRVASVIFDDSRAKEWVDSLEESQLLKMFGPREFLEYTHIGTPIVLRDRDFLTRGTIEPDLKERSILMLMYSVEDPIKPIGKYVRGEVQGFWKMKSLDGDTKTFVIAEMHADPKGSVPKWIVNLFQKNWPQNTFESLRKQVLKSDIKIIPQVATVFDPPAVPPAPGPSSAP